MDDYKAVDLTISKEVMQSYSLDCLRANKGWFFSILFLFFWGGGLSCQDVCLDYSALIVLLPFLKLKEHQIPQFDACIKQWSNCQCVVLFENDCGPSLFF